MKSQYNVLVAEFNNNNNKKRIKSINKNNKKIERKKTCTFLLYQKRLEYIHKIDGDANKTNTSSS